MTPSCPHATTTIAWLYGEAPEDHVDHVATCAECSEIAATHADVSSAMARAPAPSRPQRRPHTLTWIGLGLAAAAGLAMLVGPPPAPPTVPTPPTTDLRTPDRLDLRLDALQDDVVLLSLDLDTL